MKLPVFVSTILLFACFSLSRGADVKHTLRVEGAIGSYSESHEMFVLANGRNVNRLTYTSTLTIWFPREHQFRKLRIRHQARPPEDHPLRQITGYVEFTLRGDAVTHLSEKRDDDLWSVQSFEISDLRAKERPAVEALMRKEPNKTPEPTRTAVPR